MPNDAKLGLVVGVGLVITVAVVFHRKDAPIASPAAINKSVPARPTGTSAAKDAGAAKATGARRHTVQPGETIANLARQYLGDESKAAAIRELNPALQGPDDPPAGTVLVIPDAEQAER
jgi:nucleoid-associated protein YgaU